MATIDNLNKYFAKFPSTSTENSTPPPTETREELQSTIYVVGDIENRLNQYFARFPKEQ